LVFRVVVKPLTEEERVTGAVGNVRHANVAADEEDAILAQSRKIRQPAGQNRPRARVAAVAADPIKPEGPVGNGKDRVEVGEFPNGIFRTWAWVAPLPPETLLRLSAKSHLRRRLSCSK